MKLRKISAFNFDKMSKKCCWLSVVIILIVLVLLGIIGYLLFRHYGGGGNIEKPTEETYVWSYVCENNACVYNETRNNTKTMDFGLCLLTCLDSGVIWPKPQSAEVSKEIRPINIDKISFSYPKNCSNSKDWIETQERFSDILKKKSHNFSNWDYDGFPLVVSVKLSLNSTNLNLDTKDEYEMRIHMQNDILCAEIVGFTYYGARNGLETLNNLIVFDSFRRKYFMPISANITDKPAYKYRGLMLDTSRHFFGKDVILRVLDTMAISKLNVLHWHITDTDSFPLELTKRYNLSKNGAYSELEIYTKKDVREIVNYGRVRGIMVVPETPWRAHQGWQNTGIAVCTDQMNWIDYCEQPPCGLIDITADRTYHFFNDIYDDIFDMFSKSNLIHLGGFDTKLECWMSNKRIKKFLMSRGWTDEKDKFGCLKQHFRNKTLSYINSKNNQTKIIIWEDDPDGVRWAMLPEKYIFQVKSESIAKCLVDEKFDVIFTPIDILNLDTMSGSWITFYKPHINRDIKIIGQEAILWSTYTDERNIDTKLWPRLSAFAERLWTNPSGDLNDAEFRITLHRDLLVKYGINAEPVKSKYCTKRVQKCLTPM